MAKIKKPVENCEYVIYPLGKGLPLCMYDVIKGKKKLEEVKLRELPTCKYKGYCPKEKDADSENTGGKNEKTNNSD